jgi:hypothetical protein
MKIMENNGKENPNPLNSRACVLLSVLWSLRCTQQERVARARCAVAVSAGAASDVGARRTYTAPLNFTAHLQRLVARALRVREEKRYARLAVPTTHFVARSSAGACGTDVGEASSVTAYRLRPRVALGVQLARAIQQCIAAVARDATAAAGRASCGDAECARVAHDCAAHAALAVERSAAAPPWRRSRDEVPR